MENEILSLGSEIWRDIKGYNGHYQISNFGRIKSSQRNIKRSNGKIYPIKEKVMNPAIEFGYKKINLTLPETRKITRFSVHRLVAQAFIPNPDNLPIVHHLDDNKSNNSTQNLIWVTNQQNMELASKNGRLKKSYNNNKKINKNPKENILPLYYINSNAVCPNEIWKDINGYDGKYKISNWGRVISYYDENITGKLRKPVFEGRFRTNGDYLFISLSGNQIIRKFLLHRLVALHFLPNPESLPEVNHLDGDKTNNSISNLAWSTSKHNRLHAIKIGLIPTSQEYTKLAKLTDAEVIEIRKLSNNGMSTYDLADRFKMCRKSISNIIKRKSWKHI